MINIIRQKHANIPATQIQCKKNFLFFAAETYSSQVSIYSSGTLGSKHMFLLGRRQKKTFAFS